MASDIKIPPPDKCTILDKDHLRMMYGSCWLQACCVEVMNRREHAPVPSRLGSFLRSCAAKCVEHYVTTPGGAQPLHPIPSSATVQTPAVRGGIVLAYFRGAG